MLKAITSNTSDIDIEFIMRYDLRLDSKIGKLSAINPYAIFQVHGIAISEDRN